MNEANSLAAFGLLVTDALDAALGDVSPSAAALLLTLHYRPGTTSADLARTVDVAQPTVVRLLDGLEKRGWLTRGEKRARVTPLRLTEAGTARAEELQAARLAAMDRILAPLPAPDRAAFGRAMNRLLAEATVSRGFARKTCRLCDHPNCMEPDCPLGTRASELERAGEERQP